MNKIALILLLTFAVVSSSFAQKTPVLRSNSNLKSATASHSVYPKLSISDNLCALKSMSISQGKEDGYQVTITFSEPCSKRESAVLDFERIEEAMLFKNLILNERDYDMINLNIDRNNKSSFWVDYAFRNAGSSQLR